MGITAVAVCWFMDAHTYDSEPTMNGQRACMLRGEGYSHKQIGRLMALEDGRERPYGRVAIWRAIKKYRERVSHTADDGRRMAKPTDTVLSLGRPRGQRTDPYYDTVRPKGVRGSGST